MDHRSVRRTVLHGLKAKLKARATLALICDSSNYWSLDFGRAGDMSGDARGDIHSAEEMRAKLARFQPDSEAEPGEENGGDGCNRTQANDPRRRKRLIPEI